MNRGGGDDDDPYVDPSEGAGRGRPNYQQSRHVVETRQNMRRTASGSGFEFESKIKPGTWNRLDADKKETFPKALGKTGFITQQPPLDHITQFAAVQKRYDEKLTKDRGRGTKRRRNSFDHYEAFRLAVADPDNLRLLTHAEHVAEGGTDHRGSFPKIQLDNARALIKRHRVTRDKTPSEPLAPSPARFQGANRPKPALPPVGGTSGPVRRSPRNRGRN